MNILLATGIFLPELGGPATVVAELGKRLKVAGHSVTVVTYSEKFSYPEDADLPFQVVRVVRSRNKLSNYIRYFFAVRREARAASLVYALDWFSAGFPARLAARTRGKKYVVRVGGGYTWEKYLAEGKPAVTLRQFYEQGLDKQYRFMEFIIRGVLRAASCVIFNSDIQRELYQKHYGLDPEKTITIWNATPEPKIGNLMKSYGTEHGEERDPHFVFAGRFIKMKNVESLIRAFAAVKDGHFGLTLIGEGPEEKSLRDLTTSLNLTSRVTFLPPVSRTELYKVIAHCYCLVLPSWTDVSPNQAMECLSLGIPILMTKENYLPIADKFPLTIDPASVPDIAAKLNLLLDPTEYKKFVSAEAAIDYRHSWSDVVMEHLAVFQRALANERKQA